MHSRLGRLALMLLTARLSSAQLPTPLAVDARFTPSSISTSPLGSSSPGVLAQRADEGDDPCGDLNRGVAIGAAVGALVYDAGWFSAHAKDGTLSKDPVPYLYVGTLGAITGMILPTAVLHAPCSRWRRNHPQPQATICAYADGTPRSDRAVFAGGAVFGAVGGFLASPIVAVPIAVLHGGTDINWDRAMGLGAAIGAVWIGGAEVARAHRLCEPSGGTG